MPLVMELNYDQTSFNTVLITVLELPSLPWLGSAAIVNDSIVFMRKAYDLVSDSNSIHTSEVLVPSALSWPPGQLRKSFELYMV